MSGAPGFGALVNKNREEARLIPRVKAPGLQRADGTGNEVAINSFPGSSRKTCFYTRPSIKMARSDLHIEDQGNFSALFQNSDELYCKEILQSLNNLRHEGFLCDVTLVVGGEGIQCPS